MEHRYMFVLFFFLKNLQLRKLPKTLQKPKAKKIYNDYHFFRAIGGNTEMYEIIAFVPQKNPRVRFCDISWIDSPG